MTEFRWAVLYYLSLQTAAVFLLPKWWKMLALPALVVSPSIFFHGGYMGDVFATMLLIFACGYLFLPLVGFGLVNLATQPVNGRQEGQAPKKFTLFRTLLPAVLIASVVGAAGIAGAIMGLGIYHDSVLSATFPILFGLTSTIALLLLEEGACRCTVFGFVVAAFATPGSLLMAHFVVGLRML